MRYPARQEREVSEGDRQHRPGHGDPAERSSDAGEETYAARGGAHPLAPREERIAAEQPRARYQRMMDERRAIAASLSHRMGVMRKAAGEASGKAAIPSAGGALEGRTRATMEQQLGASLGDVKIGTGGESAAAAKQLGARAFTVGNEVHFAAGEYAPGTKQGDQLIAHELTHVVQGQRSGVQRKADADGEHDGPQVSNPDEPAEKEADAVSEGVADKLHGGGEKHDKGDAKQKDEAKEKDARPTKQQAPGIAAKLESTLKIFRAGDGKKRGDHVFNNGLGKTLGQMSKTAGESISSGAAALSASLKTMQDSVSGDAFHLTVDKGAGPDGGDANSIAFGNAKSTAMAAFTKLIHALEDAETASGAAATTAKATLTTAATQAGTTFAAMVKEAFDPGAAALASKPDKKLVSAGQAALDALPGTFSGAVAAAVSSAHPSKAAGGAATPPKKP
jgi:Domain of unknown function (DUF4157)